MNILMVASEAVPFIKTGGLGDVAGTLAAELHKRGHQVVLVLPKHEQLDLEGFVVEPCFSPFFVQMGNAILFAQVLKTELEGLSVYFIEYDRYFGRHPIYDDGENSYPDNAERFAFFSKAALDLCVCLDFTPDVVHAADWQTSSIPYYLKTWGFPGRFFSETASLLTIHNMGYQGITADVSCAPFVGLNWMQLRSEEFASFGGLNFLKGGFFYADQITTVSQTYAKEILSEPGGCGLSAYLVRRKEDLVGILNGIDTEEWNPAQDKWIPAPFSAEDLAGKAVCKQALQKEFRLALDPKKPIFGVVSRLADQKGFDLLRIALQQALNWELQFVLLGSGNSDLEDFFRWLPSAYPGKVGSFIGFQPEQAHLIEAGADFFIMPSKYEPCGLNQMYSMAYGTLPIVRATGGLADTVQNYDPKTGEGTGFVFEDITAGALRDTMGWALDTWYNQPEHIAKMRLTAMEQDFGWSKAVVAYEAAYHKAIKRRSGW